MRLIVVIMLFFQPLKHKRRDLERLFKAEIERTGVPVIQAFTVGDKYSSAYWFVVQSDAHKNRLQTDMALQQRLSDIFELSGFMALLRKHQAKGRLKNSLSDPFCLGITFESQETVDRDFEGSWFYATR